MNLLLLHPNDFLNQNHVLLSGERAAHLIKTLRVSVGKKLKVGKIEEGIGEATVVHVEKKEVTLEIGDLSPQPPPLSIHLLIALPRPQILKRVFEIAGSFGVLRLTLVNAARIEPSFFQSRMLEKETQLRYLRIGMEQGGQIHPPQVEIHHSLPRFVEDFFSNDGLRQECRLIADPDAKNALWDTPLASPQKPSNIICAIGPEGGWIPDEIELWKKASFQPIRLGTPTLRLEHAVSALLGQVCLLLSMPKY